MNELGYIKDWICGDTLLYRFTFISDDIDHGNSGLAFSEFYFSEGWLSTHEPELATIISSIVPNPTSTTFKLSFDNPTHEPYDLKIYSSDGRLHLLQEAVVGSETEISTASWPDGLYFYELVNRISNKKAFGQFIVSK